MPDELARFHEIATRLAADQADVSQGRMMTSPGLAYRGKYFAFVHDSAMVFRLGKDVEPEALGLSTIRPLNPYKTKTPVPGWFVVAAAEQARWEELARAALSRLETELAAKRAKVAR